MKQNQLQGEESREQDNPALSTVIEHHIRMIIHLRTRAASQHGRHHLLFKADGLRLRVFDETERRADLDLQIEYETRQTL